MNGLIDRDGGRWFQAAEDRYVHTGAYDREEAHEVCRESLVFGIRRETVDRYFGPVTEVDEDGRETEAV